MADAPQIEAPFHEGEQQAQERLGLKDRMAKAGQKSIRDFLPEQHRDFYSLLPFILLGTMDSAGWPWASLLAGKIGFVTSPDPQHLRINATPLADDPLNETLRVGADVGILGIELPTRRRNRLTGNVAGLADGTIDIAVKQSFGNCPKYIQSRDVRFLESYSAPDAPAVHSSELDSETAALIAKADTFFIASAYLGDGSAWAHGVDVSHRGGKPGFVAVTDPQTLLVPDFSGNRFFNTIGNLILHPKAGLLFPDFNTGHAIYISATADVIWDSADVAAFAGAERLLKFHIHRIIRKPASLPLMAEFIGYAPTLAPTGQWDIKGGNR